MNIWDDLDLQESFREHAKSQYPLEACGLVVGGKFVPTPNIAEDPANHFRIDGRLLVAAYRAPGGLQAILHSHPDGVHHPSEADMRSQAATAVPWGVAVTHRGQCSTIRWWGPGVPKAPLEGRTYVTGIQDCYGLARDYYETHFGIVLPDYPRRSEMWLQNQSLFEDFVHNHCFEVTEPRRHDAVLMRVRTEKVNHCGIYLGDDRMLHHPWVRLSTVQPLTMWGKYVAGYYRLKELADETDLPLRHLGGEVRTGTA